MSDESNREYWIATLWAADETGEDNVLAGNLLASSEENLHELVEEAFQFNRELVSCTIVTAPLNRVDSHEQTYH